MGGETLEELLCQLWTENCLFFGLLLLKFRWLLIYTLKYNCVWEREPLKTCNLIISSLHIWIELFNIIKRRIDRSWHRCLVCWLLPALLSVPVMVVNIANRIPLLCLSHCNLTCLRPQNLRPCYPHPNEQDYCFQHLLPRLCRTICWAKQRPWRQKLEWRGNLRTVAID